MKSISAKFLTAVGLLAVVLSVLVFYQTRTFTEALIEQVTEQEAALALEFDLAVRTYLGKHVCPKMEKHVGKDKFVPETVWTPLASDTVFEAVRKKFPDYLLKLSSDNPRNPVNRAGPEEAAILDYFREHPEATEWSGRIRIDGKAYSARFRPRRMEGNCVGCHGTAADAPKSLVKRYGSEAGFHGNAGGVIAMDMVGIPLEQVDAALSEQTKIALRNCVLLGVIGFGSVFLLFRRIVTRRLASIAGHFQRAAEEADHPTIAPIPVTGSDEISILASSFNVLAARRGSVHESLERRVRERTAELEAEVAERKRAEEEERARVDRARRQQSAIVKIATHRAGIAGDLAGAVAAITELAGAALEVERTGVWLIGEDRKELRCLDLFQRSLGRHEAGKLLNGADAHRCFCALEEGRVIDADDAWADPRLSEFAEGHLIPKGIASALVASIRLSGKVVGAITCGNTGSRRHWTDDEIAFAGQVADQVAQVLANQQRKQAEESLRQRAAELEAANRALAEATRAAQAATVAKSDFLANMSHEIRTPMTAILGFTDVLLEEITGSECVEAANTIKRNGIYLLEIINGLLDLAKIEAGKVETMQAVCDPARIVADVVRLLRGRAYEKGLSLGVEYPGLLPPTITTDPAMVRQILINLVGNAIKFTERGGLRVVVRLLGDRVPARLQISVIDTGTGMTAEQITHIFRPFAQADSSTTRRYGGTGLGLAISKQLATVLGGDISVQSAPNCGSTFSLTIPTGSPLPKPSRRRPAKDPGENAAPDRPRPVLRGRILLVEDGRDNQRLISLLLNRAGAEVTLAENGRVAVEKALAAPAAFDLILMDMEMPVMDGYEATRKLRLEGYGGPIVALTAHAMEHHRDRCLDAGCDGYITKPIDRPAMFGVVARYLDTSPPQPDPLESADSKQPEHRESGPDAATAGSRPPAGVESSAASGLPAGTARAGSNRPGPAERDRCGSPTAQRKRQ